MARKKLLTEGEIRQFMKLAHLRPIGQGRLQEMYPGARDEEEELSDELGATEDELGAEDAFADEEESEIDAMPPDDMGMDAEAGAGMVSMDDFMSALERAIEEVTGEDADVSEEPGDEEGPEDEVDMEMDMEMGPEGGEEMEMGEEELVAEIVRRVMERQKYGGNEGDIPDADRKKKGHYGPGGKKKETAEEEGEEDDLNELESPSAHAARSDGRRTPRRFRRGDEEGEEGFPAIGPELTGADPEETEMLSPTDPADDPDPIRRPRKRPRRGGPKGVGIPGITSEQMVNKVAKRVRARLQAQNRKEQMVDHLAERIMKRLTK